MFLLDSPPHSLRSYPIFFIYPQKAESMLIRFFKDLEGQVWRSEEDVMWGGLHANAAVCGMFAVGNRARCT
jgi:hypothetical protein